MSAVLRPTRAAPIIAALGLSCAALAGPVQSPWPVEGPDDTVCVAAAAFSGWYATADSFEDNAEVRDVRGTLRHTITRGDMAALLPWMNLGGGPDGPSALAWSASGRLLFILMHDANPATDGQPSDAVLRYDNSTGTLGVFARLEAFDRDDQWPHLGMAHYKGRLYVGTMGVGIKVFAAGASAATGGLLATITLPAGAAVHGLTIDRDIGTLFAASDSAVYRASLSAFPDLVFTQFGTGADIRALAWSDQYGSLSPSQRGLFVLSGGLAPVLGRIDWYSVIRAYSSSPETPDPYATSATEWHDLACTADGRMMIGADEDAVMLADDGDSRLSFDQWIADEFAQNVDFARGLISPDGEPTGWVIDGDTVPPAPRFHPATPDGAAWTVLILLMNDRLAGDSTAQAAVRSVLTRYAGLATDNIRPARSADGIYKHWIDPFTGDTKAGWPDEYATLSTMKIVAAAARAMSYYPDDPAIVRAASRIIFGTRGWDAYLQPGTDALAFKGLAGGGPDTGSFSRPFHEGIIFAEEAGVYGGSAAEASANRWFTRSLWPTATYVPGRPITSGAPGQFGAAFISMYPALLSRPYREDAGPGGWRVQVENVRWSNAAWTDDFAQRYYTVFSAGAGPSGYNADSLAFHPGNLSTFTSLMALSAFGDTAEAVGAYAAYRKGARQTFRTGASILYRRPTDLSSAYVPDSAGLPDVTLGALGLSELIEPGSIDAVLARPYPTTEMCPVDLNADGAIDVEDLYQQAAAPTDLNGDGATNAADSACLRAWLRRHEAEVSRP